MTIWKNEKHDNNILALVESYSRIRQELINF